MSEKTRSRAILGAVALLCLIAPSLVGCADDRPVVGTLTPSAERGPATRMITSVTTLAGEESSIIGSRMQDGCGVAGAGFQPADYSREFSCGVGRVAIHAFAANSSEAAADVAHKYLTDSGCESTEALISEPGVEDIDSDDPGAHAVEASYRCAGGDDWGVSTLLGVTTAPSIQSRFQYLPTTPGGTMVIDEPKLPQAILDEAELRGDRFVLILHASIKYYSVDVCNGLHLC